MALNHIHDDSHVHEGQHGLQQVNEPSDSSDLNPGVFEQNDPRAVARSLKHAADANTQRKTAPFRAAMSILVFYINRFGKTLPEQQVQVLEQAKNELRELYGKPRKAA